MYLLINFLFATFLHMVFFLAVVKVITGNFKLTDKELLFMLALTLLTCFIKTFVLGIEIPNLSAGTFNFMSYISFVILHGPKLFVYFFKVQAYDVKNSIAYSFTIVSIAILADVILNLAYIIWFPYMQLTAYMTTFEYPLQIVMHFLLHTTISFIFAILFARLLTPKLIKPNVSKKISQRFLIISIISCLILATVAALAYSMEFDIGDEHWSWDIAATILILYLVILAMLIHSRFSEVKHQNALKEEAISSLRRYLSDLEQQLLTTRKFQHDYKNILLPLQEFVENEQWDDLRRYFLSEVVPSSEVIIKNELSFADLSKIHVQEIKSLLTTKLALVQSTNISCTFEADQDIKEISLDAVTLVRMLGIILDNAIEALAEQENGELHVGCFKAEGGVTFIIQNTCPANMSPLNEILYHGSSTKGEGRGLGMKILTSISSSHENVFLATSIEDNYFTQKLSIEDM